MGLVGKIRACGGFRVGAPNFVGYDAIANAKSACDGVGFVLADDGTLSPKVLTALRGPELADALLGYARRSQRGAVWRRTPTAAPSFCPSSRGMKIMIE